MKRMLAQILTGDFIRNRKEYSSKEIAKIAITIRKSIINMLLEAKSGHPAGAIGMADVFATLYFRILKHNPQNPTWKKRDRLILSNGHICPVLYATLAESGYFRKSELKTLRKIGSRLQGHPHCLVSELDNKSSNILPGIENSSGPLGQGLSQAVGMAISFKMDNKQNRVYCVMGDGEQQEGQNWEAYMYAGNRQLNNLTVLIDNNNIQIDGHTEEIMSLQPLKNKLKAFNWNVIEINGHDIDAISNACNLAQINKNSPTAIICDTIPGKDIDFMENLPEWHGKTPNKNEAQIAIDQLNKIKI